MDPIGNVLFTLSPKDENGFSSKNIVIFLILDFGGVQEVRLGGLCPQTSRRIRIFLWKAEGES
jgi:hypothetical protein